MPYPKFTVLIGATLIVSLFLAIYQTHTLGWIVGRPLYIEKSVTKQERERGLGGRESLCQNCAMHFEFEGLAKRSFWMKDMKMNIDILWLQNGVVVHIENDVPYTQPEKVYMPSVEADAVLEIPSGTANKWDIQEGSRLYVL